MIRTKEKDIYVQFLGGASEVGATSIFVYWKGTKFLIDSGSRKTSDKYPIFNELDEEIDLFILTHLHQDHVGSLMECREALTIKKIMTSPDIKECLQITLKDTQGILDGKKNKSEEDEKTLKLYSEQNINTLVHEVKTLKFYEKYDINGITVTFYPTSHLIGSLGILLEDESYTLFITADFTESKKFFHPKTEFISKLKGKKIDTLITETTYGENDESDEVLKTKTLQDLENALNTIFEKDGNVLMPCFAVGRMQEIMVAIFRLIIEGAVPRDTTIYIGNIWKKDKSLGIQYTEKYFEKYFSILQEELKMGKKNYLGKFYENLEKQNKNFEEKDILKKLIERKILNIKSLPGKITKEVFTNSKHSIFLVQPGMLGSVYEEVSGKDKLALEIASSSKNGIIFAGYQAEGTIGGAIQNTAFGDIIPLKRNEEQREYIKKNRDIYKVTFPGHVSVRGVIDLVENLNPKNVLLVHGDIKASKNVAKSLKSSGKKVFIPEIDEKVYLVDNGKETFFSMQHKYSKIIIDLESEYSVISEKGILKEKEYEKYPVIDLLKNKIVTNIEKELLHFEFLVHKNSATFFQKLVLELQERNITSNIGYLEKTENLMEDMARLISDTNEKSDLYLVSSPFALIQDFMSLAQMTGSYMYIKIEENFELLPNLPFDVEENAQKEIKGIERLKKTDELSSLIRKLRYYHTISEKKQKKKENKLSQRPEYKLKKSIYKQNIFYRKDESLWGDIDTIFEVKNKVVVQDLEEMYEKFQEKIDSIQMLNCVYQYGQTKMYREILGILENKVFGKYYIESGLQYFVLHFKEKVKSEEIIDKIKIYQEL